MPRKTTKKTTPRKKREQKKVSFLHKALSPIIFLTMGVFFLGLAIFFQAQSQTKYSFSNYNPRHLTATESAYPTFISIEKIDVSLPVKPTQIIDGEWQVRDDAVSHLAASSVPGENGNIILYGHNTKNFFARLSELKKDDTFTILTIDGVHHTYKVTETLVVSPDDIWVLADSGEEEVTLYTCYGFADLKRFVVKAVPLLASEDLTISL